MPFYEYACQACGHELEALQKIADEPLVKCPECGKNKLQKLISAPSFQLKGSGWYETDFKTKKPNKGNSSSETSSTDKSQSSSSDSSSKTSDS